ncbi:type IX secretion system PorP/SprF family membrane protein [Leeuwenhoekiella aestuarii]|uniref:Type IX secretion system PorP/SprF family membrane protein n=1 Tax=Leeuwenhoekiella aestuarii TaxID=2249426 RepID=A0A4Q0NWC7_9FLAO|nr:type IX secretion system membrane protein PorP/SprF [Leeuwenhoekiella aestuarii]RXG15820.1 type IX secretion system PorP/SprF family membrane protein [Leeuwenhoekiella aestuarii]RXG16497.1 type IX secretion system PorP/SprF family membrane protein [Leeuwenhoekiella aestuarii]
MTKIVTYLIEISLIAFGTLSLYGQQEPNYTQYMYNTMTINPAYAGSSDNFNIIADYKAQFTGVDGAPETINLGLDAPVTYNIGLGLNITRDVLGPSEDLNIDGNFSYAIQLGAQTYLSFGLKAGFRVLNVDFRKGIYDNPNDPQFMNNINNQFLGVLGAGSYLYTDRWYLGLSTPNFFTQEYFNEEEVMVNTEELHMYLIGGYIFDIGLNTKFKPAVLFDYVEGAPLKANLSANFLFLEKFTAGVSYSIDAAVSGLAGFQITDNIFIGYAYDYNTSDFNQYNNGSHEILIKFSLARKRGATFSPRFF